MVHPECPPDVTALADEVLSTSGMLRVGKETDKKNVIVCTELGLVYRLRKDNPDKVFHVVSEAAVCPNMKMIDLEKVLWSLEDMQHAVEVPEDIRQRARLAVDRMVEKGG
jgi:quinolinate synthase